MEPHLGRDLAHLLAAAMLLPGFALLLRPRGSVLVAAYGLQAGLLALSALGQGVMRDDPALFAVAVLAAAKAAAVPLALRGLAGRTRPGGGGFASPALGVALVALAAAAVGPGGGQELALALAVLLLGVLALAGGQAPLAQALGLLAMENGAALAAAVIPGLPMRLPLGLGGLVLTGAVAAFLLARRPVAAAAR